MNRRNFIGSIPALASCLFAGSAWAVTRPLEIAMHADLSALEPCVEELRAAIGSSPGRAQKAFDFLFPDGEKLAMYVLDIRGVTTPGTHDLLLRLDVTDKFREFTLALAAGEFDGEVVEQTGHGGLRG